MEQSRGGGQAGRVSISDTLVNQGSRRLTLEEDGFTEEDPFLASVKVENESGVIDGPSEDEGQEETFTVTNEKINVTLQSSAEDLDGRGQMSSCSCKEEIESLKSTVNQLTLQMAKQSQAIIKQKQVITDIKACLRNFAISLATCCDDEDEDLDGVHEFSENEEISGSTAVDPQSFGDPEVTARHYYRRHQNHFQDDNNCSNDKIANEDQTVDKDDTNSKDDNDKDSSYVPDQDEEESDQEVEDQNNYLGSSSSRTKSGKTKGDFPCWKCSKSFKTKDYLKTHMRRVHCKKDSKCHLCTKVFKDVWILKRHIQSAHEGVRYKCAHCPGDFSNLNSVQRHEQKVHKKGGPPTQQCEICGIHLLNSERSLVNHMSKAHLKSQPTQKRLGLGKVKRKRQVTAMTRTIILRCQQCPTSFSERAQLQSHQSQVHGILSSLALERKPKNDT